MKKAMHIFGEILAAICVLLAVAGCQTGPKPGEASITGGTAAATRFDDGGWAVRSLPEAKPAVQEKWFLILEPMPEEIVKPEKPE